MRLQKLSCSRIQAERIWNNRVYFAIYLLTENIWCRVSQEGTLPLSQERDTCFNSRRRTETDISHQVCRMCPSGRQKMANWQWFENKIRTRCQHRQQCFCLFLTASLKAIKQVKHYRKHSKLYFWFSPRTQINKGRHKKVQTKSDVNINKLSLKITGLLHKGLQCIKSDTKFLELF